MRQKKDSQVTREQGTGRGTRVHSRSLPSTCGLQRIVRHQLSVSGRQLLGAPVSIHSRMASSTLLDRAGRPRGMRLPLMPEAPTALR